MERIGGLGPEMRPEGVDEPALQTLRWAMAEAIGLVWRLRPWLASMAPGGLGPTVRPYYEGLPIDRLDEGRTNGGESCRDQGERMLPVRSRKNGAEAKNRHGGAPRGAPAYVTGR